MTLFNTTFLQIATIGIGATAVMDVWLLLLKTLGLPTLNFAFLGRWVGHMPRGQWTHVAIGNASPMRGERVLGWSAHYATGLAFAALLVASLGPEWVRTPTLAPALLFGVGTVTVPLFVMQPAMGAGIASCRTKTPLLNCLKSLCNHTAFGLGLYVAALCLSLSTRA